MSDQNTAATWRVGCAQTKITPEAGTSLAGYFHERRGMTIRDDLFARALVIEGADGAVALVSCDLVTPSMDLSEEAKALIETRCGIAPGSVLICATHTHTGPEIRPESPVPFEAEYVKRLPEWIADAVARAAGSLFPATLHAGRAPAEGYAFNRLYRCADGSEVFGAGAAGKQIIAPAGPVDTELQVLCARDEEGRLRAMAVNFALHPDVIGGGKADFISADWPGVLSQSVASVYGSDTACLFLQGAAGDINHASPKAGWLPQGGPRKAEQLGRGLAGVAIHAAERAEPMTSSRLESGIENLSIPYYTREAALLDEIAAMKRRDDLTAMDRYIIERTESWPHDGEICEAPMQAMRVGDVGLVGFPAEVFTGIGLEIKRFSPAPFTFVVELANARVSTYVPTTDQAERGAYGAKPILSRWLCSDAARRFADAGQVALCGLWEDSPR